MGNWPNSILQLSCSKCALQDLDEDAPLHIGGLRLHCAGDSVQQIAHSGRKNVCKSFLLHT